MRVLTGNDLATGAVIWWTGDDWSIHVEDAADVTGHEEDIARREDAARRKAQEEEQARIEAERRK